MTEQDRIVEECLQAYRDGDYVHCAELARDLLDRRQAPFIVSQLLIISLQRSEREEEAITSGRWMVNALASKPWLKAMIQVTLGQEPTDLRPADDLQRCQLLFYRGARCRTLGEDDRALDLFESASRQNVVAPERELARHEATELAIVVDGESGLGWDRETDADEDERATSQLPRSRGGPVSRPVPSADSFRGTPPPAPPRIPPQRSTPPPAMSRPSMPPMHAPAPVFPGPAAKGRTAEPAPARDRQRDREVTGGLRLPQPVRRHATVRYYRRILPNRLYPLLVVLSAEQLRSLARDELEQAATDGLVVRAEEPLTIEPVLPGCTVYPPRIDVRIGGDEVTQADFRVLSLLQGGRLDGAAVVIRQGGVELATIPLRIRVGKPTVAWLFALGSMIAPAALEYFKLDVQTQVEHSFTGYADLAQQVLAAPWWAWSAGFVVLALVAAWWTWPRQDTFWNVDVVAPGT